MTPLILTVCKGNIHRSVIAEAMIRREAVSRGLQDSVRIESRGIQGTGGMNRSEHLNIRSYPNEWKLTEASLVAYGITMPANKEATPIDAHIAQEARLILAMDSFVLTDAPNALLRQFHWASKKIMLFSAVAGKHFDIQDTRGIQDALLFEKAASQIHDIVSTHFETILELAGITGERTHCS